MRACTLDSHLACTFMTQFAIVWRLISAPRQRNSSSMRYSGLEWAYLELMTPATSEAVANEPGMGVSAGIGARTI